MREEPGPKMVEQTGSTPLFAVFLIAIYSLLLIGYTCYKLCAAASPDEVVKPWEAVSRSFTQLMSRVTCSSLSDIPALQ